MLSKITNDLINNIKNIKINTKLDNNIIKKLLLLTKKDYNNIKKNLKFNVINKIRTINKKSEILEFFDYGSKNLHFFNNENRIIFENYKKMSLIDFSRYLSLNNKNFINNLPFLLKKFKFIRNIDNYIIDLCSNFISLNIILDIEKNLDKIYIYKSNYNNNKINLEIITNKKPKKNYILKIFSKINLIILLGNLKNVYLEIKIYESKIKKKLNSKKFNKLGSINANSGVSSFNFINKYGKITIFRKEECQKVLLHEIIHSLNLDYKYNNINTEFIFKNFNINKENLILLNEGFVETYAIILNSLFISIDNNINLKQILLNEIRYSLFQFGKILDYYEFNCYSKCNHQFVKINKKQLNLDNFIQDTSIFSYYFIKSQLFYNFNIFIKYILHKNKLFYNKKNFLEKLIKECFKNKNYETDLNKLLINIKKNKKNNYLYKNLRMSLYY